MWRLEAVGRIQMAEVYCSQKCGFVEDHTIQSVEIVVVGLSSFCDLKQDKNNGKKKGRGWC